MNKPLYIAWNSSCELGISIIDEQHRGVISLINSLFYSIRSNDADTVARAILIMLEQYAKIHFAVEERLMEERRYPEQREHLLHHHAYIERVNGMMIDFRRNVDPDVLMNFLKEWWLQHMSKEDRELAEFLLRADRRIG